MEKIMRFRIKNSVPAVLTVILGAALTTAALADPVTDRADDIVNDIAKRNIFFRFFPFDYI